MRPSVNGLYDRPALHRTAFNAAFAKSGETRANEFDNLKTILCTGVDISLKDSDNFTALDRVNEHARDVGVEMIPKLTLNNPHTDCMRVSTLLGLIPRELRELVYQRKLKAADEMRGRMDIPHDELKALITDLLRDVCATTADLNMDNMLKEVTIDMRRVFRRDAGINEDEAHRDDCGHKHHYENKAKYFRYLAEEWYCR